MTTLSPEEQERQRLAIRRIMGYDKKKSYWIFGKVLNVKKELQDLGMTYDKIVNRYQFDNIPGDHKIFKFVKDNEGLYMTEKKS